MKMCCSFIGSPPSIDFASFHLSGTADLLILDARIEIIDLKVELSFDSGHHYSREFQVL